MATRKQATAVATTVKQTEEARLALKAAFEKALGEFTGALQLMRGGDFAAAREAFQTVAKERKDEPALVERARTYIRYCERKLAPGPEAPTSADDLFYNAVLHINNGKADEALRMLDQALAIEPESPRLLYAKASAAAIKGDADSAVTDLRRAIAGDPQVRFQAGNDPDFEKIREEPAFIDIIEPTPTGA